MCSHAVTWNPAANWFNQQCADTGTVTPGVAIAIDTSLGGFQLLFSLLLDIILVDLLVVTVICIRYHIGHRLPLLRYFSSYGVPERF